MINLMSDPERYFKRHHLMVSGSVLEYMYGFHVASLNIKKMIEASYTA